MVSVPVMCGQVAHVNSKGRYVIIKCEGLPSVGEEAKVYRGEKVVAGLRISNTRRPPFIAADILEGLPEPGDTVKVMRRRPVPRDDGGAK